MEGGREGGREEGRGREGLLLINNIKRREV